MISEKIKETYKEWVKNVRIDNDIITELRNIENDEAFLEDAFYKNLDFGTGGLRGVIGAGTNRMNVYTVGKASQGLADYIIDKYSAEKRKIAISYDSRIKSYEFAKVAAGVFAANGIQVYIYSELMPTPCLSYAVRELECAAGIMITASHNPAKYNGYKVYGEDGCQITTQAAKDILYEIEKLDIFRNVRCCEFEKGVEEGKICYIDDSVYTNFIEAVKKQSMINDGTIIDKNVKIVYTPLNGTGLKPVMRVLTEAGYSNITIVKEQEMPDGEFPTCKYPNPEIKEAMCLGIEYASRINAELLLATDPDCDRVGIAVKNKSGEYVLLSGNETGILLLDYICSRRCLENNMPSEPIMVKTIVTMDMAERIAADYGVKTVNVLTGFKYIGEQIGLLESSGRTENYIFGFEESYGYLSGSYVRDKDAVNAVFLICEMFAYYKMRGETLIEKLNSLYSKYGYCLNTLHSYEFEGAEGLTKMKKIMETFRTGNICLGDKKIERCVDYSVGVDGLPKSNVLKYYLSDNCSMVIRPSGTEPKLKIYFSVSGNDSEEAQKVEKELMLCLSEFVK